MTSTSFVFTELANKMKYGGGLLYNLVFTEWRYCVSQNEVWGRGVYNLVVTAWRHCVSQIVHGWRFNKWINRLLSGLWFEPLVSPEILMCADLQMVKIGCKPAHFQNYGHYILNDMNKGLNPSSAGPTLKQVELSPEKSQLFCLAESAALTGLHRHPGVSW